MLYGSSGVGATFPVCNVSCKNKAQNLDILHFSTITLDSCYDLILFIGKGIYRPYGTRIVIFL
jgi:hypothetical protein